MPSDSGLRGLALRTLLAAFGGPAAPDWTLRLLSDGLAGLTLFAGNIAKPVQLSSLSAELRSVRPEILVAIDEEAGDVTRLGHATGSPYPGNAALGAIDDPALTRDVYAAVGAELAEAGLRLNLAPTVDVNTTSDNPIVGTRAFGTDPTLVARHAAAAVTGLQSAGVAACAKHFPGHGATEADSHTSLPTVDAPLSLLRSRDLPPFAAAIEAGTKAIMTAHIRIPSLTGDAPATLSHAALHTLLRSELGFDGVIVTDALEMAGAVLAAGSMGAAAVRSLEAGADLLCLGAQITPDLVEHVVAEIEAAVRSGALPLSRLEDAAARVATLATWASTPRQPQPRDPRIGYASARRAVTIDGTIPALAGALIVQLDSPHSIAEGKVPWGLAPQLSSTPEQQPPGSTPDRPGDAVVKTQPAPTAGPSGTAIPTQPAGTAAPTQPRGTTTPTQPRGTTTPTQPRDTTTPTQPRDTTSPTQPAGAIELLTSPAGELSAAVVAARADGRPIVIVGRRLHRSAAARALIEGLTPGHTVVAVEMGWPSAWRPSGVAAFVITHGASHANGRAAAEALGLLPG